jgi:hypothetical protein
MEKIVCDARHIGALVAVSKVSPPGNRGGYNDLR